MSVRPALVPVRAPLVSPVTYTFPDESTATPAPLSEEEVPNCLIPLQGVSDHTAYNVTFADPIANVEPVARDVPDASDAVFQPVNEYPVRARFPVLFSTVTVVPFS